MLTSDTIGALAAALAKAQGELSNTTKDQRANAGKAQYRYANIASVLDDVRPVLARHGLAVVQGVGRDGEDVAITTRLIHESGEWVESMLPLPVDRMGGIQGVGSAITYGRRYGLQAMLGIASDDDDGATAQAQPPRYTRRPSGPPAWLDGARRHVEAQGLTWEAAVAAVGSPVHEWTDATKGRIMAWVRDAKAAAGGEE